MRGRCRLKSPKSGDIQSIDGVLCDWYFTPESLDKLRDLDERSLVDAILNFRKIFPKCSDNLDRVSRRLRLLLGTGYRISVELDYCDSSYLPKIVKTVCLDANSAPILDNSL